jgi:hypothetical protein
MSDNSAKHEMTCPSCAALMFTHAAENYPTPKES